MNPFTVDIEVRDLAGQRFAGLQAMADTGATTTVIPASVLGELGMSPTQRQTFEYADGRKVDLDVAPASVRVEGRETITWVIFGEDGTGTLLGAYTLEGAFLGVDPYNQKLIPVHGVLK